MGNISGFSKKSWQRFNGAHPISGFFVLLLVSVPFSLGLANIMLGLFAAASLYYFRRHRFVRKPFALLLPIALFALMCASALWSIDLARTLKAIPREIFLFAIPVCCMLFPALDGSQKKAVLAKYAYGMSVVCAFYLANAFFRFLTTGNAGVFFYHELVTEEVNAIHVSIYVSVAFFSLLPKAGKTIADWMCMSVLALVVILLSSKNVIVVFGLLVCVYFAFFSAVALKAKLLGFGTLALIVLIPLLLFPKISDRFLVEATTVATDNTPHATLRSVNNVSVRQAWTQQRFSQNDYFPGAAFRVYQLRVFKELFNEDGKFWLGYGLNATQKRIADKAAEYNLFKGDGLRKGYQGKNFHNQYVQNFSDLGIFGLLLLVGMLFLSLKNGLESKDFTHISFAVLMISLFLTESFLLRQRGVMFFTAVYCLLNSGAIAKAVKKE